MSTEDGAQHRRYTWLSRVWFWPGLSVLLLLAAGLRLGRNDHPGYDVDELLYEKIAANLAQLGHVEAKAEYIGPATTYLSHPPFLFMVEAGWFKLFGASIIHARLLTACAGILTVLVVGLFVRYRAGRLAAILAATFMALDGWLVFTNRVAWAENVQIPFGILVLWLFERLYRRQLEREDDTVRTGFKRFVWPLPWRLLLAGAALGGVMAYKTVGIIFPLGAVIYLLTQRSPLRYLVAIVSAIAAVMVSYFVGMFIWAGRPFLDATFHQFLRVTGKVQSRGTVTSLGQIGQTLLHQYSIYLVSLAVLGLAGVLIAWRAWQFARPWLGRTGLLGVAGAVVIGLAGKVLGLWSLKLMVVVVALGCLAVLVWCTRRGRRPNYEPLQRADGLLLSWAAGAFLIFVVQRLTLPHYLILIMVPAFCYLASELAAYVKGWKPVSLRGLVVAGLVAAMVLGGLVATYVRVYAANDNAVGATITYMTDNVPPDAKVIADEFMGNQIPQPYCKITHAQLCETQGGRPGYIISYETTTQKLPDSAALQRLLTYADPQPVFQTTGFKETIKVFKLTEFPAAK